MIYNGWLIMKTFSFNKLCKFNNDNNFGNSSNFLRFNFIILNLCKYNIMLAIMIYINFM